VATPFAGNLDAVKLPDLPKLNCMVVTGLEAGMEIARALVTEHGWIENPDKVASSGYTFIKGAAYPVVCAAAEQPDGPGLVQVYRKAGEVQVLNIALADLPVPVQGRVRRQW
jgi:hypothetical protein